MIAKEVTTLKESLKSYDDLILYEHDWLKTNLPMMSYWLETRYHVKDYKLPTALHPTHYDLTIGLENDENFFNASVKIDITVVEPTFRIVLNSHNLEIHDVKLYETPDESTAKEPKQFRIVEVDHDTENQKLVIYLDTYIEVSKISVEITYAGYINTHQKGLYRNEYMKSGRNTLSYIATYFRPNYARMVFPCFDEPNFKAKFKLRIKRKFDVTTLSNVPLEDTLRETSYDLDIYQETPIMSTYLLSFIVSDFKPIRNTKEMFNIWGVQDLVKYGYSVQYAAFEYYEALKSFVKSTPNLFKKLDLISLPNFDTSSVESWGLFFFQDNVLFYEDEVMPLSQKHTIFLNIAKEIAHVYFGNLVTCERWSYAWLNEGLSQYFQWLLHEKGMDETFYSDYFVVEDMHDVMEYDITLFSHPLIYSESSPAVFSETFDKISSKKAASLIRMLHYTYGGPAFYSGLEKYIDNNQYKTVTPNELWSALESNLNDVSIKNIMNGWLEYTGCPVVRAYLNNATGVLELTQAKITGDITLSSRIQIPISIATQLDPNFENTSPKFWLTSRQENFATKLRNHWFVLNVQQSGYYRVQYDDRSFQAIVNTLQSINYTLIHVINRAQIIDDAFHLAWIYETSNLNALKAAMYLRHERENMPWKAFERAINFMWNYMTFYSDEDRKIFHKYVTYITEPQVSRLRFDDDEDNSSPWPIETRNNHLNRELILSLHCKFDSSFCLKEATKWSGKNVEYRNISTNAKPAILCTLIKHGDTNQWNEVWEAYLNAKLQSEKLIYLDALGCTENEADIKTYLNYIFEKKEVRKIRKENIPRALASLYKSSRTGWRLCYEYMINHHTEVYELLEDWNQVANIFVEIVRRIRSLRIADEFNFFLKNNHEILEPITDVLTKALYTAKVSIKQIGGSSWIITNHMKNLLKSVEVKEVKPNISTTQSANILLIAIMSIVPFLLIR